MPAPFEIDAWLLGDEEQAPDARAAKHGRPLYLRAEALRGRAHQHVPNAGSNVERGVSEITSEDSAAWRDTHEVGAGRDFLVVRVGLDDD